MIDRSSPPTSQVINSVTEAHDALNHAALLREDANQYPHLDDADPALSLAKADQMEAAALAFLHSDRNSASSGQIARRIRSPRVAAIAAKERLALASEARSDELAIDMAESLEAENSAQTALAHQMSAAHALSLRLMGRVNLEIEGLGRHNWQAKREAMVEIARLSNAAARLMDTFQRGFSAMAKAQGRGAQPVLVQRVQINDGGQAVVAGQLRSSDKGSAGEKS